MKNTTRISKTFSAHKAALILAGSVATLLTATSAPAATYYWDTNAATGFGTVTGAWNTSAFWNTDSTGAVGGPFVVNPTAADDLNISAGTTGTITLTGTKTGGSLTISDPVAITITGGTLALGGTTANKGLFVTAAQTAATTVSSAVTLNAATTTIQNGGTGVLTINGGITGAQALILNNNGATGAGIVIATGSLNNAGTVTNSGTGAGTTISAVIGTSVTKVIQNSATSPLTLSGANTFTSGVQIKAGIVVANSAAAFGTGTITFGDTAGSAAVQINGNTSTFANPISVTGGNTGTATLSTNSASPTFSGAITLNTHDLRFANSGFNITASGGVAGTGSLILTSNGAGVVTLSGAAINNIGTISTTGVNSSANGGTTLISAAVGANVTQISNGQTGSGFTPSPLTVSGAIAVGAANKVFNSTGTSLFTISGGVTGTGTLTFNNNSTGGITVATGSLNNVGTITNSGSGSAATALGSVIGTNVTSVIQNSPTSDLILSGVNTFSSGVSIRAGSVSTLTSAAALGTGAVLLGDTTGSAAATLNTGATALTFTNNITVQSGSSGLKTLGHTGAAAVVYSGTVTLNGDLTINSTGTQRLGMAGLMTGAGALTVTGAGNTVAADYNPSGLNNYSGGTTLKPGSFIPISASSVGVGAGVTSGVFGTGILNLAGGQLRSGTGGSFTIGNTTTISGDTTFYTTGGERSLIFAGPVTLTGGTRILTSAVGTTVAGTSVFFSGSIGDAGSGLGITKEGLGNLTLTGVNTYGGNTNINAGALTIGSSDSLPGFNTSGRFLVANGATLAVYNAVSDANVAAMLGTINFAAGSVLGFDTVNGDRTLSLNLADTTQGTLGVSKVGANTLTLSGNNSYSGNTTVTAGGLSIASTAALPGWDTNGRYSLSSGATLIVQNGVSDAEVSTIIGTTNLAANSTLGFDTTSGDRTYTGAVSNTPQGLLGLTKFGSNTLTLTGPSNHTGVTTVTAGTLLASGTSTATGNIVVGNTTGNAVLNVPVGGTLTGGTITAGTANGSAGAVNVTGGTLTLNTPETTDAISFGGGEGGYGAFTMSSGTFTQQRFMFGGVTASTSLGGVGVGLITNGTVNATGWLILSRAGASTGILTITGGVINHAGASQDIAIGLQGSGRAELNVAGGLIDNSGRRVDFSGGTAAGFHWTGTGLLNVNAGTLLTNAVFYDTNVASANASSYVNFNGGTLKASSSSAVFLPAFVPSGTGVNRVLVNGPFGTFAGGAVIDTNGFNNTVAADLLAPTGDGVTSLSLDAAGSGYIGAPAVKILDNGNPSTATGYAVVGIDPANVSTFGKVTSVVITNPGVITGTPTVSLVGGGGTGAAVSVASTGANTSGGLTKIGAGILTLTGSNTFTGLTSVTNGTLSVSGSGTLSGTSGLSVSSGARFTYLPNFSSNLVIGTSGTLTLANNSDVGVTFGSTIAAPGAASVGSVVNLVPSGSFSSGSPYLLLSAASGLNAGVAYNVLNATDYTFTTNVIATAVEITPTSATPLSSAYWVGGLSTAAKVWAASNGSASNWTTDGLGTATPLVPGASANVFVSDASAAPGNQVNMTLGADMAINSLTVNSPTAVSLLNSGGSTLTVGGLGGLGITVEAGSGSVTVNPNITVSNSQTWTNTSSNPLTFGGTVSTGGNVLIIDGSGATSIANLNSGTGGLIVAAGTTSLNAATLSGAQAWTNNSANVLTAGTVSNGGFALTLTGTGDQAITGVLSGAGALIKTGLGAAVLSGANTYTGATTVSAGTLTLSGNRTASNTAAITVGNVSGSTGTLNIANGTFTIGQITLATGDSTAIGVINQTGGSLTMSGTQMIVGNLGTGTTSGSNSTGTYNLSGGTLTGSAAATRGVLLGTNTGTTGIFNLSGTGVLALGSSALEIGRSDGASAATNSTGIFNQTGGTASVGTLAMGGAAGANFAGTNGTLNLSGGTFSAATFTLLSAGNTSTSAINISGTAEVTLPAFPTARGTSSTASITFDGGTLSPLAASATYISGLTNAFIKSGGAQFDVAAGKDITVPQALLTHASSLGGGLTKLGLGTMTVTGTNTYTGTTTIASGTVQLGAAGATGSLSSGLIVNNGSFVINRTNAVTQSVDFTSAGITGTGAFKQVGSGTTTLNAANLYAGPTIITGGVLQIGGSNNIGDGSVTNSIFLGAATLKSTSGTYDLGVNRTITLTGAAKIQVDADTVTLSGDVSNGANTLSLFGPGSIIVNGVIGAGATPTGGLTIGSTTLSARVTLSGNNLFTGNVSLPASNTQPFSVLTLTSSGALGVGPKTVSSVGGGEFHLQNNITLAANISFTVSGSQQQNSNATANHAVIYNDSGNNTINGNISMQSGNGNSIISSDSGLLTLNGNLTALAVNRQLQLRGDGDGVINGIISNGSTAALPVVKDGGTGTWTLSNNNTYTGATTVTNGVLNINGTIGAGANVVNANGGTTNFGVSQTLGALNIADGAVVALGAPAPAPAFAFDSGTGGGEILATNPDVAAVPEPGSPALLMGGICVLLGFRRRSANFIQGDGK